MWSALRLVPRLYATWLSRPFCGAHCYRTALPCPMLLPPALCLSLCNALRVNGIPVTRRRLRERCCKGDE
jgi:hypothetical protein